MGLQAIGDGLKAALEAVDGLERVYTWMPDSVAPPCVVVGFPERVEYQGTFGAVGMTTWLFPITLYASRADALNGQRILAAWLDASGPASVRAALEADPTLGGACDTVLIQPAADFGAYDVAGTPYLGMRERVQVVTSG